MTTYLIYYTDCAGVSEAWEVFGTKGLRQALKWLHGPEVQATSIAIYKHGPNFENDPDDVLEVQKYYWK